MTIFSAATPCNDVSRERVRNGDAAGGSRGRGPLRLLQPAVKGRIREISDGLAGTGPAPRNPLSVARLRTA